MKIQINDRILWLTKVNTAIQDILDERQRILDTYNAQPWHRQLFNGYNEELSQMYAWYDMEILRRIKAALETDGTGDVWINEDELRAIL